MQIEQGPSLAPFVSRDARRRSLHGRALARAGNSGSFDTGRIFSRATASLRFTAVLVLVAFQARAVAFQGETPIQDNSLLIEEAYNQEAGVVQHISLFTHSWEGSDWAYRFTQEWPVIGRARHQLSYDIPVLHSGEFSGSGAGLGDLTLNYRYQASGGAESPLSFSPRLSLLLPTGKAKFGRGYGGAGLQGNLPISVVLAERWVTHLNGGMTLVPRAQNETGKRAFAADYNLGQSFIWLAHSRLNLLLETIWNDSASVVGPGKTERERELWVSPGVRWAHNFRNGLQIVPGVGVALGVGPSAGDQAVVIYLSFEHPFAKQNGP